MTDQNQLFKEIQTSLIPTEEREPETNTLQNSNSNDNEIFYELGKETSSKFSDQRLSSILKGLTSQFQYDKNSANSGKTFSLKIFETNNSDYIPMSLPTIEKMKEDKLLSQYTVNLQTFYSRLNKIKKAEEEYYLNKKNKVEHKNKIFNETMRKNKKHLDLLNEVYNLFDLKDTENLNLNTNSSSIGKERSVLNSERSKNKNKKLNGTLDFNFPEEKVSDNQPLQNMLSSTRNNKSKNEKFFSTELSEIAEINMINSHELSRINEENDLLDLEKNSKSKKKLLSKFKPPQNTKNNSISKNLNNNLIQDEKNEEIYYTTPINLLKINFSSSIRSQVNFSPVKSINRIIERKEKVRYNKLSTSMPSLQVFPNSYKKEKIINSGPTYGKLILPKLYFRDMDIHLLPEKDDIYSKVKIKDIISLSKLKKPIFK